MQNMQEVYQRKYKKIQDISASIGGIINLIIVVSKIIYKFFEKYVLINDMMYNLKIKCNDVVRNVYKTDFNELKINKICENIVKTNNYLDTTSKNKINTIESPQLKKINQLNSIKKIESNKFNLSFSKIIKLSSLNYNKFKRVSYLQILMNNFYCLKKQKNYFIDKLENFRKNIISEEGMFTTYYILLTFINKNNKEIKKYFLRRSRLDKFFSHKLIKDSDLNIKQIKINKNKNKEIKENNNINNNNNIDDDNLNDINPNNIGFIESKYNKDNSFDFSNKNKIEEKEEKNN
jgi:hypothetical protein